MKIRTDIFASAIVAISVLGGAAPAVSADLSSGQLIACRDEVHFGNHGFKDLPMAAFSVWNGGDHSSGNADWAVKWDGIKASGTCQVGPNGKTVHKVTVIEKRKSGNKPSGEGGFYYDRHVAAWRDPDGKICHTCTPENGFPDHGKHDKAHNDHRSKLEKQMQRQINNELSQSDIDQINAMVDGLK